MTIINYDKILQFNISFLINKILLIMKYINLISITFLIIITACSKDEDTTTKPCTVTTLTATLPGKWKLANTGSIMEFKADKTYTDVDKALHSCTSGAWAAIANDTKIDMICGGSSFKEISINRFVCDTVQLQLSGIGPVNIIRQK